MSWLSFVYTPWLALDLDFDACIFSDNWRGVFGGKLRDHVWTSEHGVGIGVVILHGWRLHGKERS